MTSGELLVGFWPDSSVEIEVLGAPDELLGAPDELLGAPDELLGAPDELLGAPDELLGAPEPVVCVSVTGGLLVVCVSVSGGLLVVGGLLVTGFDEYGSVGPHTMMWLMVLSPPWPSGS